VASTLSASHPPNGPSGNAGTAARYVLKTLWMNGGGMTGLDPSNATGKIVLPTFAWSRTSVSTSATY
jgi:hypothetical protein